MRRHPPCPARIHDAFTALYQAQLDGLADAIAELPAGVPTQVSVVANTVGAQVPGHLALGPEVTDMLAQHQRAGPRGRG